MRLISRKIWRAFPELDRFDDQVCAHYIRHARRMGNQLRGAVVVLLAFVLGIVIWLGLVFNANAIEYYLDNEYYIGVRLVDTLIGDVVSYSGYFWFPILFAFFVRDRWLIRSIRKQLGGIACAGCGYSLRGLTIETQGMEKVVTCPECGVPKTLNHDHITEADINPALLTERVK